MRIDTGAIRLEELKYRLDELAETAKGLSKSLSNDGPDQLGIREKDCLNALRFSTITGLMEEATLFMTRGSLEDAKGGIDEAFKWASWIIR